MTIAHPFVLVYFVAVAVLILVIASINFMNLATARATQRAREVGVRKVVGASRGKIIAQFIGESVLLTLIGLMLAEVTPEAVTILRVWHGAARRDG